MSAFSDLREIAGYGVRRNRAARRQMENAVRRQIEGPIAVVRHDGEVLELLDAHPLRLGEIAHIDDISFQQLIERRIWIVRGQWGDHPLFDVGESVRHQAETTQLAIDVAQQRLAFVERQERYLGLHRDRLRKLAGAMPEYSELATLDVDLEKIE